MWFAYEFFEATVASKKHKIDSIIQMLYVYGKYFMYFIFNLTF